MFHVNYRISDPPNVNCSLTVTMPLHAWKQLRKGLEAHGGYPEWKLANAIRDLMAKLEGSVEASGEYPIGAE